MTHKGNGDQMIDDLLDIENAPEEPKRKRKNDEVEPLYMQALRINKAVWERKDWGGGYKDDNGCKMTIRIATVWAFILIVIGMVWLMVALVGWVLPAVIFVIAFITFFIVFFTET